MKALVISYNGFSDSNANGKTLKNLFCEFKSDELCQFYCGTDAEDYSFCDSFFHVTDREMLRSFYKKKSRVYNAAAQKNEGNESKLVQKSALPQSLRRYNYNFILRTAREILWKVSPWGRKEYKNWLKNQSPDIVFYMVGESWFMDELVLKTVSHLNIPLVLFHTEAYKIIDLSTRKGIERLYYRINKKSYKKLKEKASLIIYNCNYLKAAYEDEYSKQNSIVAYNSFQFDTEEYTPSDEKLNIVYFGNLGVGRVESLVDVANELRNINDSLVLDIYGKAKPEKEALLTNCENICYHGLVEPDKLIEIKNDADIFIHAESFDENIVPKLKFAFSTKIAQYLCAGRCTITYAPLQTASTQYFVENKCALIASSKEELRQALNDAVGSSALRCDMSKAALKIAKKDFSNKLTGEKIRKELETIVYEN